MACTHPRIMAVCDISKLTTITEDGQVIPNHIFVKRLEENNWKINYDRKKAYRLVAKDSREHQLEDIPSWSRLEDMEIPCGNCIQCRLDYSKTWATRCYLESLQYSHNYFVTLTYEDGHLKFGKTGNPTVQIADLRKFIKDLRQNLKRDFGHDGVRFFGCTEYGDQSFRPHGHLILFNCPIPDLTINFPDDDGNITQRKSAFGFMYFSQYLKDLWPYGFITVEDANFNTEAYVSRYIMKKQKGKAGQELYVKQLSIEPPQLMMSLKPGIGMKYFVENVDDLIENPIVIIPRDKKEPLISGIPRLYKKKITELHPELYEPLLEKAKENTLKSRSLLKGHQLMNDNRRITEESTKRKFEAFGRDLN